MRPTASTQREALPDCLSACLPDSLALSECGSDRGNGARLRALSIRASFAPLDIHEYVFGGESCATRLSLEGSVPLRPRFEPRLALSSALAWEARHSSLAPAPRRASPAPCIDDPRRLASSLAHPLRSCALLLAMLAPRRACREPKPAASLSSLIAPRLPASLVHH